MSKKKWYFRDLRKAEIQTGESYIRLLEMTVDGALKDQGYAMQFWQDVRLYGVNEAILYVRNGNYATTKGLVEIEQTWVKIKEELEKLPA